MDWPLLRANLKPRLTAMIAGNAAQSGVIGGSVKRIMGAVVASDTAIHALVTPANLGRLLASRAFLVARLPGPASAGGPATAPLDPDPEDVDDPMPPRRLRWAFFESPSRFRIEAEHPRLAPNRIRATLALQNWAWKLVDVEIIQR